jgi:hypothetical protein
LSHCVLVAGLIRSKCASRQPSDVASSGPHFEHWSTLNEHRATTPAATVVTRTDAAEDIVPPLGGAENVAGRQQHFRQNGLFPRLSTASTATPSNRRRGTRRSQEGLLFSWAATSSWIRSWTKSATASRTMGARSCAALAPFRRHMRTIRAKNGHGFSGVLT